MNLLMINDEVLTAETMRTDIDWKVYGIDQVFTAYSADSARECIEKNPVDILLCDIEMPGENGLSLLRWCRDNKKTMECIFLTCHAAFSYAQEAISLGCQDYILVPEKYENIGQAVLKVVNRIIQRQEEVKYQEYGKQAVQAQMDHAIGVHGEKKDAHTLVAAAERYILKNLGHDELSVNGIAENMYMHPVYLNRIFKKEKGTSVSQFIINERMKISAELIKSGHLSANAVAEQVGYRNYSNFNLTFKKHFNCTPSQYKEQQNRLKV